MMKKEDFLVNAIYLFLLYSVVGWLYEVALAFIYGYGFINRGFLIGPYLPIYGFGALILIGTLHTLLKKDIRIGNIKVMPLVIFIGVIIITTAIEYLAGWILEAVFNQRWWDYSSYKYQLHGRISLSASIRFGFGGMLFLYGFLPVFNRLIALIPVKLRKKLAVIIAGVLIADFALSLYIIQHIGVNPILAQPR